MYRLHYLKSALSLSDSRDEPIATSLSAFDALSAETAF